MYNEDLKVQYVIMTEENKNDEGSYVPNYDGLIAEALNDDMTAKWIEAKEFHEKLGETEPKYQGFAFNSIYMMKMSCDHYEIFQHHSKSEDDLIEWIALMQSEKYYKKCTRCICELK